MLRQQTAEIQNQAASATVSIEKLQPPSTTSTDDRYDRHVQAGCARQQKVTIDACRRRSHGRHLRRRAAQGRASTGSRRQPPQRATCRRANESLASGCCPLIALVLSSCSPRCVVAVVTTAWLVVAAILHAVHCLDRGSPSGGWRRRCAAPASPWERERMRQLARPIGRRQPDCPTSRRPTPTTTGARPAVRSGRPANRSVSCQSTSGQGRANPH